MYQKVPFLSKNYAFFKNTIPQIPHTKCGPAELGPYRLDPSLITPIMFIIGGDHMLSHIMREKKISLSSSSGSNGLDFSRLGLDSALITPIMFIIGGDHLIPLPHAETYNERKKNFTQFRAHTE